MSHEQPESKKSLEFQGKQFEVDEPTELMVDDIHMGDRVLITTQSGNRYMIRRSKSRSGALMVYNEKNQFDTGSPLHVQAEKLAEVGKPFDHFFVTDAEKRLGTKQTTTPVVSIEIRRGLDEAANTATNKGDSIVEMLKKHVRGRDPDK